MSIIPFDPDPGHISVNVAPHVNVVVLTAKDISKLFCSGYNVENYPPLFMISGARYLMLVCKCSFGDPWFLERRVPKNMMDSFPNVEFKYCCCYDKDVFTAPPDPTVWYGYEDIDQNGINVDQKEDDAEVENMYLQEKYSRADKFARNRKFKASNTAKWQEKGNKGKKKSPKRNERPKNSGKKP